MGDVSFLEASRVRDGAAGGFDGEFMSAVSMNAVSLHHARWDERAIGIAAMNRDLSACDKKSPVTL